MLSSSVYEIYSKISHFLALCSWGVYLIFRYKCATQPKSTGN